MSETTAPTAAERAIVAEFLKLLVEARGDHEALAEARRQISVRLDSYLAELASCGVDTDALLDELEEVA